MEAGNVALRKEDGVAAGKRFDLVHEADHVRALDDPVDRELAADDPT